MTTGITTVLSRRLHLGTPKSLRKAALMEMNLRTTMSMLS
jgi:hypothetical protein